MKTIRVVVEVVSALILVVLIALPFRGCGKSNPPKTPTPGGASPSASVPARPPAPLFSEARQAVTAAEQLASQKKNASIGIEMASGKPAEIAEEGYQAEQRPLYVKVRLRLQPEELKAKEAELARSKEAEQGVRDTIRDQNRRIANLEYLLGVQKRNLLFQDSDAGGKALRRKEIREKEEALSDMRSQLLSLQESLRETVARTAKLERDLSRRETVVHRFSPGK